MEKITLFGRPITKKNSQRIISCGKFKKIAPSKQFEKYQDECLWQLNSIKNKRKKGAINSPINLKAVYYMNTKHRVDLVNLLEGTCDILVEGGILEDDNCKIVVSHDGSRVLYDKENPRAEITIESIKSIKGDE